MVFDFIYDGLRFLIDPIFAPILNLPPIIAILLIALIISVITTLAYKWMTDQVRMKQIKEQQKEMQKEIKANRDNPKKVMELNKKAMETSLEMMRASLKPMLITMLPVLLIFMWLNLHLSYLPVLPGQEFNSTVYFKDGVEGDISLNAAEGITIISDNVQEIVDGQARWTLKGEAGEYYLDYFYEGRYFQKELLITEEKEYKNPIMKVSDSNIKIIAIDQQRLKVNFGFFHLSWFWTYLIFTLILSSVLRKVMKVY